MAWRCTGATNADLIANLFRHGLITSPRVRDAMLAVDRANYAPNRSQAYVDSPQPIGHAATISAPHMHALALESLLPYLPLPSSSPSSATREDGTKGDGKTLRVLDVGSGSGYLTHVLAELVGEAGTVVGVEHISALKELGEGNVGKSSEGRELLRRGRVKFVVGDGRKGWREPLRGQEGGGKKTQENEEEGWDVIHVGAAAVKIHDELVAQLRRPGRMFIPVDDDSSGYGGQHIYAVDKDETGAVTKKKLYGVSYVPLTDAPPVG